MKTKTPNESEVKSFFEDVPLIHSYTRAEAIEDGTLVDVSEMARQAGFRYPVALTCAVWNSYVRVPEGVSGQDEEGRLWDILSMTKVAVRNSNETQVRVELFVRNSEDREAQLVELKAICGPGDSAEPVITILLPNED